MANNQNTSSVGTRRFDKDLNEDVNDYHLPENSWTQARNAINNSITGDLGKIGNEPANILCISAPYTIISFIHVVADTWLVYSTDDINSAIGIFKEDTCSYTTIVDDPCLNFKKDFLIKGVSRAKSDCTYNAYWDDGLNVSRAMPFTIDNPADNAYTNPNSPIPWIQECKDDNNVILPGPPNYVTVGCITCTNTPALDCDKIRLARYITTPCIEVKNGIGAGTLLNGSYMVAIAYSIAGQKISDWFISNVQSIFHHGNAAGSIDVSLYSTDTDFNEIQICLISVTNQQTVARLAGIYSTHQKHLSFDTIDNTWPAVPIEELPLMNPIADKTDAMYNVNDYLIRVGPTSKEDFNYQPIANQILTKWQSVEYPANYYRKGGNKTNYLRDEVYPFFIRWVFDTGDKSSSYHIPGRPALSSDFNIVANNDNAPERSDGIPGTEIYNWIVYNTASQQGPALSVTLPDGGVLVAEGFMGYWESSEKYPDDKPQIWNATSQGIYPTSTIADYHLCGKPIRHHKFPDLSLQNSTSTQTQYVNPVNGKIRIMGVAFENIKAPLMNDGITPVSGIVGYEILRGARNGNKTVLAKGLINNMRTYTVPDGTTNREQTYPNYPYNETGNFTIPVNAAAFTENGRPDPFLSTTRVSYTACPIWGGSGGEQNYHAQTSYSKGKFTFHSPDTNFTNPYLSAKELKIHGEFNGDAVGKFEKSEQHPKEKLITNTAFIVSAIGGIGLGLLASNGQRTTKYVQPKIPGYSQSVMPFISLLSGTGFSTPGTVATSSGQQPTALDQGLITSGNLALQTAYAAYTASLLAGGTLLQNLGGGFTSTENPTFETFYTAWKAINATSKAYSTTSYDIDQQDGQMTNIPFPLRAFSSIPMFFRYFTEGTDTILDLFKAIARYRDFALRYESHAYYNRYERPVVGNTRRVINTAEYMGPQITDLGLKTRVNNLYRVQTVGLVLENNTDPSVNDVVEPWHTPIQNTIVNDVTRIKASSVVSLLDTDNFGSSGQLIDPTKESFGTNPSGGFIDIVPGNRGIQIASSHYASLKQRLRNQYGQINGIIQVPASNCVLPKPTTQQPAKSGTIFGGDTYVGRYTEKNTFFFFYNWLYGQPDGAQFDYTKNEMLPFPRFWANFDRFETSDFTSSVANLITSAFDPNPAGLILPSNYYNLDGLICGPGGLLSTLANIRISVKDAYFYLFNSSVRDFMVESEINVDLRDWTDVESEQHYDPYRYTDLKAIFDTKIIRAGNYYKYDQSLSVAKLFLNYTSWGNSQTINYNPFIAETCYVYNPSRLIYSLPSQFESARDNWYIYLANNYVDFDNIVTCIKSINKSGALIFFDAASPLQFLGLDQLETTSGTKLTIGDGGLFSQPMQSVVNADSSYEYGSCQDGLSVISTPAGLFWINQNQGKIFNYQGGLVELSMLDIKWWLAAYLPYKLTKEFPDFTLTANPVNGIGCQSMYDNENGLIYFSKRDFITRTDLAPGTTLEYIDSNNFKVLVNGFPLFNIKLGDLRYFEDASWTISYDPKSKGWISYHDWHPELNIPGKNTFLTTKTDNTGKSGIWIHNKICNLYCNYYGVDYPFEVEYMVNTVQTVNTLRSVEYILEVYKYAPNCYDRFHILDANFDEAVIFNTEQVSGMLELILEPKNDPQALLAYPVINPTNINIMFAKVENRYRFNQFWDITADRGEYNLAAQRMIWNTGANGYVRTLNPANMNYSKDEFQRKKFRHYTNSVFLRKKISGDQKMLVLLTNNKDLYSPR